MPASVQYFDLTKPSEEENKDDLQDFMDRTEETLEIMFSMMMGMNDLLLRNSKL